MTELPRITIVTPCLNARATIQATLDSIAAQHYPNLQHVVVDGGSTDGTLDLLRDHPSVELISEPDEGLSDALNKGFRRATGDLVGWLNADDLYLAGALDAVARAHTRDPEAGWITGHCRIVGAEGEEIRSAVTRYKSAFLRRYRFTTLLMQNYISAPATFLTKSCLAQIGEARLDQHYAMDYDLWLRAGRLGPPIVVDDELAAFRMISGTLSMTGFEQQFREHSSIAWQHSRGTERLAAAVNTILSRAIVVTYRLLARRTPKGEQRPN